MVVGEALDFPGAVTQGFDLPDARLMIAIALEDVATLFLEEGRPLPVPLAEAHSTQKPTSSNLCRCRFMPERFQGRTARTSGPFATVRMYCREGRWPSHDLHESGDGAKAPVPRHGELNNRLARKICDQLSIAPDPMTHCAFLVPNNIDNVQPEWVQRWAFTVRLTSDRQTGRPRSAPDRRDVPALGMRFSRAATILDC